MSALVDAVIPALMRDEGFRRTPYRCSAGKLTIGYGTNLDDGLDDAEAMFLLEHRALRAELDCRQTFPWFATLDARRQGVLIQLRYQLGLAGLLGFRQMLAAIAAGDFVTAAADLLDSKLARVDAPARAQRLAAALRRGAR